MFQWCRKPETASPQLKFELGLSLTIKVNFLISFIWFYKENFRFSRYRLRNTLIEMAIKKTLQHKIFSFYPIWWNRFQYGKAMNINLEMNSCSAMLEISNDSAERSIDFFHVFQMLSCSGWRGELYNFYSLDDLNRRQCVFKKLLFLI